MKSDKINSLKLFPSINSLIIHKESTKEIGHLHYGVILLLRPEFSFSYVNLEAPVRFE